MAVSWVAVELATGKVIADLPDLILQGAVGCTLMRYESQTAQLPLDTAPAGWRLATNPGFAAVVCLDEDGVTPLWGGLVLSRKTNLGSTVELSLATLEAYMDRRYVGDHSYSNTDQNAIVSDLIGSHMRANGVPIRVQVIGGAGQKRTRTDKDAYLDTADKTLYSVLDDLSGVLGGPEWTIGWEYTNNLFTPVLYVGTRVGAPVASGLGPNATFYSPGPVNNAELVEAYTSGQGANNVMATSSGIAGARPQSAKLVPAVPDGRPTFEYRWSPSTSITDIGTLTDHAQRALNAMQGGSLALTMTAARSEAPRLGRDWGIGDDIGFDLVSPAWPNGLSGTARCIGWKLDDREVTPIVDISTIGGLT